MLAYVRPTLGLCRAYVGPMLAYVGPMLRHRGGYVGHRLGICWLAGAYVGDMLGNFCGKSLPIQLVTCTVVLVLV